MEQRTVSEGLQTRLRARRRIEYPDIRGKFEDDRGSVQYEVLQVSNGNALVWMEQAHPSMPRTASGGFGWVEHLGAGTTSVDSGVIRRRIERSLRSHLTTGTEVHAAP